MMNMRQGSYTMYDVLVQFLEGMERLIILGIGNDMRGDDGAGVFFIEKLSKCKIPKNVRLLSCGTTPENFTSVIVREKPSHMIIVDCVELSKEPGTVAIIDEDKILNFTYSTHKLPLTLFLKYLRNSLPILKVLIIGIQPESVEFGKGLSPKVRSSIENLVSLIEDVLVSLNR
mgnify:CR=1 FL=1